MHDLAKYLLPPLMKGESDAASNFNVCNQEFKASSILLAINYRIPSSMQDEFGDHPEEYRFFNYEYWCDLLFTIEVEDENKIAASHIKNIASSRSASLYDSD